MLCVYFRKSSAVNSPFDFRVWDAWKMKAEAKEQIWRHLKAVSLYEPTQIRRKQPQESPLMDEELVHKLWRKVVK